MKGSVILFNDDNEMTIIENVEEAVYQDMKEQEGSDHCVVIYWTIMKLILATFPPFIGVKAKYTLTNIQDLHYICRSFYALIIFNLELNVKRGTSDSLTHTLAHSQLKTGLTTI